LFKSQIAEKYLLSAREFQRLIRSQIMPVTFPTSHQVTYPAAKSPCPEDEEIIDQPIEYENIDNRNNVLINKLGIVFQMVKNKEKYLSPKWTVLERDDLVTAGIFGIYHAMRNYNPDKYTKGFSRYTRNWVLHYVMGMMHDWSWIPPHVLSKLKKEGCNYWDSNIAVPMMLRAYCKNRRGTWSCQFNRIVGKDKEPCDILIEQEKMKEVDRAFKVLDNRSRYIISNRLKGHTLQWIGDRLNITRERVRQIQKAAMIKVKRSYRFED
jgi:RNA polymerase sigma factor (sigma-70 family)